MSDLLLAGGIFLGAGIVYLLAAVVNDVRDRRQANRLRDALASEVWRNLEAAPGFNEAMERGIADLDAGRLVPFDPTSGYATDAYYASEQGEQPHD